MLIRQRQMLFIAIAAFALFMLTLLPMGSTTRGYTEVLHEAQGSSEGGTREPGSHGHVAAGTAHPDTVQVCLQTYKDSWRAEEARVGAILEAWEAERAEAGGTPAGLPGCPSKMPEALKGDYTQGGEIRVLPWYKCQPATGEHPTYTTKQIEDNFARIAGKHQLYYKWAAKFIYKAIEAFPVAGQSVAVLGSQRPNFESIALFYNASRVTSIDYHAVNTLDDRIHPMSIADWEAAPVRYDAAISVSSFEHDGLGRYGDPLFPDGDIRAVDKTRCMLRPGGRLYLSVPVGRDTITWNMHRVYGRSRLHRLLAPMTLLGVFGNAELEARIGGPCDAGVHGDYQPIFVLENTPQPDPQYNLRMLDSLYPPNDALKGQCPSTPSLTP